MKNETDTEEVKESAAAAAEREPEDGAAKEADEAEGQAAGAESVGGEAAPEGAAEAQGESEGKDEAEGQGESEGQGAAKDGDEKPSGPDWKDLYARTLADFENFRKRTERDREDIVKSAAKDILKDLLATADNLALALEKAHDKDDPFVKGVQLVYDGFIKVLADHGATPVDAVGEPFDTAFHDALTQQPSDTVPEGHVIAEFKRGWLLNGKLLRAAQVIVSSGKAE